MLSLNTIHHLTCFDFLKQVDDDSVDLVVTDPPYNMSKGDWDTFHSHVDFMEWTCKWLDEVIRTLKSTGSLYVFNTPYNSAFIFHHLLKRGLIFQNWITWDKKDGHVAGNRRFPRKSETILFFTKSEENAFNVSMAYEPYLEIARMRSAMKTGLKSADGKLWFPNPNGARVRDVWHFPSAKHADRTRGKVNKQFHPTQKPVEMIKRIIAISSNEGDVVLDCFVGSGTTAVAAFQLGRNYLCADGDASFVEFARERVLACKFPKSIKNPVSFQ